MAISERDIKLLWGRSAGHCNNPDCRTRVSVTGKTGESYLTGEMAHVVARQIGGPRGVSEGGPDDYGNLVLLCPTCHTIVDKAPPGDFPVEVLLEWKRNHESWVESWSIADKMNSLAELMNFIWKLLEENQYYFIQYGPKSQIANLNPASSAYSIWIARRLDAIIPNNKKITSALDYNRQLIPDNMRKLCLEFRDHALGFEQNQYNKLDFYPLFPVGFSEAVMRLKDV